MKYIENDKPIEGEFISSDEWDNKTNNHDSLRQEAFRQQQNRDPFEEQRQAILRMQAMRQGSQQPQSNPARGGLFGAIEGIFG